MTTKRLIPFLFSFTEPDNAAQLSNMMTTMIRHDGSPLTDAIMICPRCPESNQWVDTPWANGSYSIDTVKRSNELTAVVELIGVIVGSYSTDADKSDVRRSRVRSIDGGQFDIHDRVNYSVTSSSLEINDARDKVTLSLTIDTAFSTAAEYFEIFLGRMLLCKKAAGFFGLRFELIMNGQSMM